MKLELDRQVEQLIEKEISAGHFSDAASVIGAAVRHLVVSREELGHSRAEIDSMIGSAVDSLGRGGGVDGEEFFAELERREASLHNGE